MTLDPDKFTTEAASAGAQNELAPSNDTTRKTMKKAQLNLDTVARQKAYVAKEKAKGDGQGVVFQAAFIRGMRDLGYKDPAWALAELIDNAVQANASAVEIRLGFDKGNTSKAKNPSQIAIVDNGTGMQREMIGYAVRWGGTDREDDRNGFGRFGYGLPSSCVSIACTYTVYSKVKGDDWYAVTIDLKKLAEASSDPKATEALLTSRKAILPEWLHEQRQAAIEGGQQEFSKPIDLNAAESGTVIVLEDLDRLRNMSGWIQVNKLKQRLLHQLGMVYRHWIPEVRIAVDGVNCQAIDPLFLLPHAMYVDETPIKAKKVLEKVFDVPTRDGRATGSVRIRASFLDPLFTWLTPDDIASGAKKNKRWEQVLNPYKHGLNGLLICREGRQIDVVPPSWTKFQNNDAYLKIEIDFDPILDEYFNITTSKQQIRLDDEMVDRLRGDGKNAGGLASLIADFRAQSRLLRDAIEAKVKQVTLQKAAELPSANAMREAARFKSRTPRVTPQAIEEAKRNLNEEVDARKKETGRAEEEVRKEIEEEAKTRPWDINFQAMEEGPFYIPKRMGEQKRIVLNTAHPFYSRLYSKASGEVVSALQVLLFVLADGEIEAEGHRGEFYKAERHFWSGQLGIALSSLVSQSTLDDDSATAMELEEQRQATS